MNGYLVDTNIPSELTRLVPEPLVAAFLRQAGKERVFVSALTFGEICKGIGRGLRTGFCPSPRPSPSAGDFWLQKLRDRGRTLSVVDGLIAATAREHDLTLVTRNMKDFGGLRRHPSQPVE